MRWMGKGKEAGCSSSESPVSLPQELKVEGETLQRVCPKTGRNPRSGSPIRPWEIFLLSESECNSALRKNLTFDLQTVSLTLNRTLVMQIFSIRVSLSIVLPLTYFWFVAGGADCLSDVIFQLRGVYAEAYKSKSNTYIQTTRGKKSIRLIDYLYLNNILA